MDAAGHFTSRIQAGDDVAVYIQRMALGVNLDTAHGVVSGGSHQTDAQLHAVQGVGIGQVIAVLILLSVADQTVGVGLLHVFGLLASHDRLVVALNGRTNGGRVGAQAQAVEQVGQLIHRADVLTPFHILVAVQVGAGDLGGSVSDFDEYALGAVVLDAVAELRQAQHVALGGFIHKALAGGGVDVDGVVAAAEGQVAVVYPADRHHLGEAHAGHIRARSLSHYNAVALQGGTVGGLGAGGNVLAGPVDVAVHNHVQVRGIAAGGHDNALGGMRGDGGAVIAGAGYAGHAAVFND